MDRLGGAAISSHGADRAGRLAPLPRSTRSIEDGGMIRLTLDSLVKRFDRVAVVDGASLEARPGELTIVLGPSGAGKSTLARLIAGLETLDHGEIFIDGKLIHSLKPKDRKVGLVFQEDSLWPRLTVAQNVDRALAIKGLGARDRKPRIAEALAALRIESIADRRPHELNGSQRVRATIGRAIALDPDLLILDDPTGRVDPKNRGDFREELRALLAELQTTTLLLTSDPSEALSLADRVAVMDLGRIVQTGAPAEIYNRPTSAFVAQYLGPTNLLHGQVEGTDARGEVVARTPLGRLVGIAAAGPLADGATVTVSIRPEAIGIGDVIPPNCNRFPATIERQLFQGELRRVFLRGPGDWPVQAVALQSRSIGLREGQVVTLFVPSEFVVVLPGRYATTSI